MHEKGNQSGNTDSSSQAHQLEGIPFLLHFGALDLSGGVLKVHDGPQLAAVVGAAAEHAGKVHHVGHHVVAVRPLHVVTPLVLHRPEHHPVGADAVAAAGERAVPDDASTSAHTG
eukprot:7686831-Pyramimonas_sp.AAC.2